MVREYQDTRPASPVRRLFAALDRGVPALPLDVFRILLGLVFFAYFVHLLQEAEDFSGPDGLIDHRLVQDVFWYTRLSLFQPGITVWQLQAIFSFASLGALALAAGYRVRLFGAALFLIAVSAYRWNFPVMYFDDAIMHLMLAWTLLLPMGRTLVFGEWRNGGMNAWNRWKKTTVPGGSTRCFLWNLMLVYFVAGVWKLGSTMWQEGTALHVALQTPAAWAPHYWKEVPAFLFTPLTYLALAFELSFPLFLVLPKKHPVKWIMLLAMAAFHVGTLGTLRVPYANLALLASTLVICRDELSDWLNGSAVAGIGARLATDTPGFRTVAALALVASLSISTIRVGDGPADAPAEPYGVEEQGMDPRGVGGLTSIHKPVYALLWFAGIAQRYELFDWIDSRNYALENDVKVVDGAGSWSRLDPATVFPQSGRGALLQSYLHDLVWVDLPSDRRATFRERLIAGFSRRFCRSRKTTGRVVAGSSMTRIMPDSTEYPPSVSRVVLTFRCDHGSAEVLDVSISKPPAPGDV